MRRTPREISLTSLQRELLDYMVKECREFSAAELAKVFLVDRDTMRNRLIGLVKKGCVAVRLETKVEKEIAHATAQRKLYRPIFVK